MSLDGKLLRQALERLDEEKRARASKASKLRAEAYAKLPRIREIDSELRSVMLGTISLAISKSRDVEAEIDNARKKSLELQAERTKILALKGYKDSDIDDEPKCKSCGDTGYNGTKPCACLMDLYRDEQRKELSACLKLGQETFNTFNLEYYDDKKDQRGISPRKMMSLVFDKCCDYARKFDKNSPNLFLRGGTGLGKTFLSTSIAKVVSEKGFSVVYDTAVNIFSAFEDEKFGRSADAYETRDRVYRYLNCDLLIIDDLGTEMLTNMVLTALYTLINTRLSNGKKTIINSNLNPEELEKRYSQQIVSRLKGEYINLDFYGRDIRIIKRESL
jgi:DNA replication protein DnaC